MMERRSENCVPAETIRAKAVAVLAFSGKEQHCLAELVLNAFQIFSIHQRHVFSLLTCWMRVQFHSDRLSVMKDEHMTTRKTRRAHSRNIPTSDFRRAIEKDVPHGIEVFRRQHIWLREYELKYGVIWDIRPINDFLDHIIVGAHGEYGSSRYIAERVKVRRMALKESLNVVSGI